MSRPLVDPFPVLFGGYVGGLATFAVGAIPGLSPFGWQAGVAGVVAFAGTVAVVATRENFTVELVRSDWNVVVIGAPILALLGWFGVVDTDASASAPEILLLLAVAVLGLAVYVLANRTVIQRARDTDAVVAEWTASATARRRRWQRVTLLAGGVTLLAAGFVVHHPVAEIAPTLGGMALAFTLFAGRAREYSVLPTGLYVQPIGTLSGQFVPWSRLTGYRVTDDALIVDRWIPLLAFTSRLDDIDDLDAVTTALDCALDGDAATDRRDSEPATGTD